MRYFLCIGLFMTVNCVDSFAQYNSDHKQIARKRIKAATAYEVDNSGDTITHKFSYDENGCLTEVRVSQPNGTLWIEYYSASGMDLGLTSILFSRRSDTATMVNGVYFPIYDTAMVSIQVYKEGVNTFHHEPYYWRDMSYRNGKLIEGRFGYYHGDTSFLYDYAGDSIIFLNMNIWRPVDTLLHGYSITTYFMNTPHKYPNLPMDTLFECFVFQLDKHGNEISLYDVLQYNRESTEIWNNDGTLYCPADDTSASLELQGRWTNHYRSDGTIEYYTWIDPVTKKKMRKEGPAHPGPRKPFDSLIELGKFGTIIFEYYP